MEYPSDPSGYKLGSAVISSERRPGTRLIYQAGGFISHHSLKDGEFGVSNGR